MTSYTSGIRKIFTTDGDKLYVGLDDFLSEAGRLGYSLACFNGVIYSTHNEVATWYKTPLTIADFQF